MYANYGEKSDFDYMGSCEGNIVIMRYGKIYRGTKVRQNTHMHIHTNTHTYTHVNTILSSFFNIYTE